ncbi:hypothetical protein BS47DRAFT_1376250 [Hydnum rufescens UP504]|uniref:NADP-dependent oxidoreductase domain-containing protein n=1 Tax=Hydnum rufescens UP504 TaxID=1448309 RepID=A0A9P6DY07_9AGAM|nr:hypothetical protein BS47DRAFT_1376250 [Hydnum rufescens UP504]
MLTRKIGDVEVAAIGYGAMGIGGMAYVQVLDRLFELGCHHWDTASIYGDSEELIGKWFERTGKRDKIFLATKFGLASESLIRGDPEFVESECAKSLAKLKTDHIDLYYQHRSDTKTPIEVTVGTMAELVSTGKVKYLGLSEASPSTIRRAHAIHPISAIQVEYSPFEVSVESPGGVLDTARELGIAVVAYSPTGRGLATGRYQSPDDFPEGDFRREVPRFSAGNFPLILKVVEGLQAIAAAHKATPAQVGMAWLIAQGNDIIAIPGSKQIEYCDENWEAGNLRLSDAELKGIRKLVDEAGASLSHHGRYPPGFYTDSTSFETPLPQ